MVSVRAKVKPEILRWARTSAGFAIEEAAKKIQVKPDKLAAWEDGEDRPTINQLRNLAKAFRRPISTFYLSTPPKEFEPSHDFRRLPGEVSGVYTPALKMEIRAAWQRRELALDLLEEIGEEAPSFAWRATIEEDPEEVGQRIREALVIRLKEQSRWRGDRKAYNAWRRKIEAAGVLVFQIVGVPTADMRGLSIAEDVLPVIAVNQKDHPNGRTFSLLHEFTHLLLRESGLCDMDETSSRPHAEQRIEVFCNHVAGAALVPAKHLFAEPIVAAKAEGPRSWGDEELRALAHQFGVSREVVLRRLLTLGRTTNDFYSDKRREFLAQYKKLKDHKKTGDVKRNLAREAVSNYGRTFNELVLNTYRQDRITLTDVTKYLTIRTKHLPRVEEMLQAR